MPNSLSNPSLTQLYEAKIDVARKQFDNSSALSIILASDVDPKMLEAFLIYYNALGVSMTQPVEDWINRAGNNCKRIGLTELGQALCSHAKHEAGHHLMMINDTKFLVTDWNRKYEPKLDAKQMLEQPITDGVENYIKLHEDMIESETPFGQLAIELEIESLSVRVVPSLMEQFKKVLGSDILEGVSFLEDHVALDVSHTQFNKRQLDKFLTEKPDALESLVNAGEKALEAYEMFLSNCISLAKELTY